MRKIIKDKRGLEFKNAFFAMILVGVCVVAITGWIVEWDDAYDSGLTPDLDDFNKQSDIQGQAESQKGSITIKSAESGEDFEGTSIRGVYGVLSNIYEPFRLLTGENGMLSSLSERFGIPSYIIAAIVTMVTVAITFTLVAILFRLTRRSA